MLFKNKPLAILFGVLLVIAVIVLLSDSGQEERTFKGNLVSLDTASVTRIEIEPKDKSKEKVILTKEGEDWIVKVNDDKNAEVPHGRIEALYRTVQNLKPTRLAARGEARYKQYQVDSSAARVTFYDGNEAVADLMLGRFSFKQQTRQMNSFVRLADEDDIYEVEGMLQASISQDISAYRDSRIIKTGREKWSELQFDYPADSSFTMAKVSGKWQINGTETDSAETEKYLSGLNRLTSNNFIDDPEQEKVTDAGYTLTIMNSEGEPVVIKGYENEESYLVHSSDNPDTYFDGNKNKLAENIFTGKSRLLK